MYYNSKIAAGLLACALMAAPAEGWAGTFEAKDAYARSSTPSSTSGAAFMALQNLGAKDDRLIGASSDVARRVELHSHSEDANGVMRMGEIEGGVPIAAGETHLFKRGGDHLMFMGLTRPLAQGEEITVTLEFESAGAVPISVVVDHKRKPAHSGH